MASIYGKMGKLNRLPEIQQRLLRMSVQHSVYVIFGLHPSNWAGRTPWEHVATGALVRFRQRPCVVTDAHIIRAFEHAWEQDSSVTFQIGGARLFFLDVQGRMHSLSDASDLAVIDVTGIESDVTEGQDEVSGPTFYEASAWPPADILEGDVLFFGGYRDRGRSTMNHVLHHLDTYSNLSVIVTDVYPDRFKCKFDRTGWTDALNPDDQSGVAEGDFSGLSGAPIFRLWTAAEREEYRGREFPLAMFPTDQHSPDLVGFVMEHSPQQDMLVASASVNIKSDGTLWPNTKR